MTVGLLKPSVHISFELGANTPGCFIREHAIMVIRIHGTVVKLTIVVRACDAVWFEVNRPNRETT